MDFAAASVLPLKRYAQFRGRSTRTEVVAFYVLTMVVMLVAKVVGDSLGLTGARPWLEAGLGVLFLVPTLALYVRRLHDWGRSGWWLLVGAPFVAAGIWELVVRPRPFTLNIQLHLPWWAVVSAVLSGLAVWALLLWPDDASDNRYGPNPRCEPLGEPA